MTRTQKKNRKRRAKEKAKNKQGRKDFRAFLDERGIAYQEKTKGHYLIGDVVYFYKAMKYQKKGCWYSFNSHEEFLDSL